MSAPSESAPSERELVAELSHEVISEVAPHELPLFRPVSSAYFANPNAVLRHRSKDEMLGFGTESAIALTPYVLAVAAPVVGFLLGTVRKAVQDETADAVRPLVRRLIKRAHGDSDQPLPLTPSQLEEVRRVAFEKGRQLDLPDSTAELLADAMVGCLAVPA